MQRKTALIAGATGLVGRELLQLLLAGERYDQVVALVRKPLQIQHPKLIEVVVDFDNLLATQDYFQVDDVFCCLGTTIKKAKTQEAMYKVDVEYPLRIAKLAQEKGAKHFLVISAMNANPNSMFFYNKIKGQLEEQLKAIPFEALSICQPALLLGEREEFRLGELLFVKGVRGLSKIIGRPLSSRVAIEAKTLAAAMYRIAGKSEKGIEIYSSGQLGEIAKT